MTATAVAAVIDLGFAGFHFAFWYLFGWPRTLAGSGPVNAAVTQTLNIMLTVAFLAYGSGLLWNLAGGHTVAPLVLWCGAGFWVVRAALQPLMFPMANWPSIVITIAFVVAVIAHALAALA